MTISGNSSHLSAGMQLLFTNATLNHVTISGNTAWGYSFDNYSERHGDDLDINAGNTYITNSIVWGDSSESIYLVNSQPIITYSDIAGGFEGEGNINNDPLFTNPENGD